MAQNNVVRRQFDRLVLDEAAALNNPPEQRGLQISNQGPELTVEGTFSYKSETRNFGFSETASRPTPSLEAWEATAGVDLARERMREMMISRVTPAVAGVVDDYLKNVALFSRTGGQGSSTVVATEEIRKGLFDLVSAELQKGLGAMFFSAAKPVEPNREGDLNVANLKTLNYLVSDEAIARSPYLRDNHDALTGIMSPLFAASEHAVQHKEMDHAHLVRLMVAASKKLKALVKSMPPKDGGVDSITTAYTNIDNAIERFETH